jgi:hypothetical protein
MNLARWLLLNGCNTVALGLVALFSGVNASLLSYGFGSVVMSLLYEIHNGPRRAWRAPNGGV